MQLNTYLFYFVLLYFIKTTRKGGFRSIGESKFENAETFIPDQTIEFIFFVVYERSGNQTMVPTGVCYAVVSTQKYVIKSNITLNQNFALPLSENVNVMTIVSVDSLSENLDI